jgi:hypothetical protein
LYREKPLIIHVSFRLRKRLPTYYALSSS